MQWCCKCKSLSDWESTGLDILVVDLEEGDGGQGRSRGQKYREADQQARDLLRLSFHVD